MSITEKNLISLGVKPNWLGRAVNGKLMEYRSLPWKAGVDFFVLVQELGKPETVNCVELRTVKPLMVASASEAA